MRPSKPHSSPCTRSLRTGLAPAETTRAGSHPPILNASSLPNPNRSATIIAQAVMTGARLITLLFIFKTPSSRTSSKPKFPYLALSISSGGRSGSSSESTALRFRFWADVDPYGVMVNPYVWPRSQLTKTLILMRQNGNAPWVWKSLVREWTVEQRRIPQS